MVFLVAAAVAARLGDIDASRYVTLRLVWWSTLLGIGLTVFVLAIRPWLPGWFSDDAGRYIVGPLGMARMLRRSRAPYRFIGAGMLAPGVRHVLKAIGPWMYAHRGYLPGATDSCTVPAA